MTVVQCRTAPSWIEVRFPIVITFRSPRGTAPGQMDAWAPMVTFPIIVTPGR